MIVVALVARTRIGLIPRFFPALICGSIRVATVAIQGVRGFADR
jgi:hypothetical protein